MLSTTQLERRVKGFSSHRRIQIMLLLDSEPGISLLDIAEKTKTNFKTSAEHTRRLRLAGMITKKYRGNMIAHKLSSRGQTVLRFLRTLE